MADAAKKKPQKIEISVESLVDYHKMGVAAKAQIDSLSANQVALRKATEESLKQDPELKDTAENIAAFLEQGLLNNEDERIYVLIEDVLEDVLETVKEHAKNYLELQGSTEAKVVKAKVEKAREEYAKAKTLFESVNVMLDHMGWDHSEVPEFPSLSRGGRPAGSRSSNGTKGVKEFDFHFTRDGEKQPYDNVSRALWYSSVKSNGSAKDGRLTSEEFKKLLKEQKGFDNEWAQSWEVKLPNGKTLGFVRTEKPTTDESAKEGESQAS